VRSLNAYQNLAGGAPAASDTVLYNPDVAVNGDTWADSGAGADREFAYNSSGLHYLQVDLGAVYSVDKVKVWHYGVGGRTYHNTKTEVSADGVTWTTVFDSAGSGEYAESAAGKTHTFTADPITGRRWISLRYKALGEGRYAEGAAPTKLHFTGQRELSALGLHFYYFTPAGGRPGYS
jgi:hypothetical protein